MFTLKSHQHEDIRLTPKLVYTFPPFPSLPRRPCAFPAALRRSFLPLDLSQRWLRGFRDQLRKLAADQDATSAGKRKHACGMSRAVTQYVPVLNRERITYEVLAAPHQ